MLDVAAQAKTIAAPSAITKETVLLQVRQMAFWPSNIQMDKVWSIRSDEGLTLETSALESLYGGQFTFSTLLMEPNIR